MIEEFVILGKWWLPSNPAIVVPGKLSFSPESGAELELIGSFYNSEFQEIGQARDFITSDAENSFWDSTLLERGVVVEFIKPQETIILGLLENNEEITLYNCSGRIKKFEFFKGRAIVIFNVRYIFKKIHFQEEESIKLKSISVEYAYLREWIGKSGIKAIIPQEENKLWITYQPPSSISLARINDLDVSITFSRINLNPFDVYLGATYYQANIEQKTYLTIKNNCNQPLDKCIELLIHFRDLLSFAISKPSSIISITANVDVNHPKNTSHDDGTFMTEEDVLESQIIIMFGLWNSGKHLDIKVTPYEMLFLFTDVGDRFGEIFIEWLNKRQIYEPVFNLLMTTMYTPDLYLDYGFLNIIQALEVYHGNKYKGTYQDDKVYKNGIYKKLLEVIQEFPSDSSDNQYGITNDFRQALKGKLNFQNQVSLQTRLNEILADISHLLPDNFIGSDNDKQNFVSRASNTRHALAHHNKKQRKKAARGKELSQLFHTLSVILHISLLRELNFTDDLIKALIARNRQYQREWQSPQKLN
ncbi:ApeA N-terminal domain 1-containing protein [Calothrix sp. NIES-2098]|uniref:ApeA N-terminal domain 1-containing protein n=1 Tax=Calothrix sp. NIES-2098 TaxID=1954171 RepID=UPI000B600221|nr:hypothetical protein NIES2098_47100 [Calothrix sp. NIES-2098]